MKTPTTCRPNCPGCRSTTWGTLGYCHRCGHTACSECAAETTEGLYCSACIRALMHGAPEAQWPEIVAQETPMPEPVNGWVN